MHTFPFIALVVDPNSSGKKKLLDREWLFRSTIREGRGLALSSSAEPNLPLWSCRYNVMLSLALFNNVRPPGDWEPPTTPTGMQYGDPGMKLGLAGEDMLPLYTRKVINDRLGEIVGQELDLKFETVEFPENDSLVRIRIDLSGLIASQTMHDAVTKEIEWCFPYITIFTQ